jgi:RNA polymerase sigma factor (TIGR02999 family)
MPSDASPTPPTDDTPDGTAGIIASLLSRASQGETSAAGELLPLVYDHLRQMARTRLANEAIGHTLQPTALVHVAYLKLVRGDRSWSDKRHFFAAAAIAMRQILVDRARAKKGPKRGGAAERVSLDIAEGQVRAPGSRGSADADPSDSVDWLALESAMKGLEQQDPMLAEIVQLRYFAGLTVEETAMALGVSDRTVNREWLVARAWLLRRMKASERGEA